MGEIDTMSEYTVVVGNIGTVYQGDSLNTAKTQFEYYCNRSHAGIGLAGGERVVLCDSVGEPIEEYEGADGE